MITQQFILWVVCIPHVPPAAIMFITNCILLWWSLDSVLLPLVLMPKVVTEALQWGGERKCKVTSTKPNWQANWNYNGITALLLNDTFVWRRTDLQKTVQTWTDCLSRFRYPQSQTRINVTSVHMINYPLYDAMHEKPDFPREQPMYPPKVHRTVVTTFSLIMHHLAFQ